MKSVRTEYYCISLYKIVSKIVAKLIKYIILFMYILTFSGLDHRDASLISLYLVVIGIRIQIIRQIGNPLQKFVVKKVKN